jgi:Spy/CpxP family protein refolding chaperone
MMSRRYLILACALFTLVGSGRLLADEAKAPAPDTRHKRLEALAAKLGLDDQQKEQVRKIHTEFVSKAAPIRQQLTALHREQREAMSKVFTEEQRSKLKDAFKAAREQKWQAAVAKLKLTDEQKQRIEKVRAEYGKRFEELASQKGEDRQQQFRALRHEKYQAIGRELTDEQRAELREMVWKEFRQRHDPEARMAFWKGISEKLDLSAEQKDQLAKIRADFAAKKEKPAAALKELRRDQHAALAKVLTEEQRTKLQELWKARKKDDKQQDVNGKE